MTLTNAELSKEYGDRLLPDAFGGGGGLQYEAKLSLHCIEENSTTRVKYLTLAVQLKPIAQQLSLTKHYTQQTIYSSKKVGYISF